MTLAQAEQMVCAYCETPLGQGKKTKRFGEKAIEWTCPNQKCKKHLVSYLGWGEHGTALG